MADLDTILEEIKKGDSKVPEVVGAVLKEVKTMGDNQTKSYEELRKNVDALHKELDSAKGGALSEEKILKLTEDITVRQDVMDKFSDEVKRESEEMRKGLDALEVAIQRMPKAGEGAADEETKLATEFMKTIMSVQSKDNKGATMDRLKARGVDIETYRKYVDSFDSFLRKDDKLIDADCLKALQVGIDPDGGYTVTPMMGTKIIQKLYESDPIRQLAAIESITTGAIEWAVDRSEADTGWETETVSGDETGTPQFAKKRIEVHTAYARPKVTQTLLDDSGINIDAWLANKIADKLLRTEAAAFVTGTGIGRPRGFLTYDDGTDWGQVEQICSGHATLPTADGLYNLKYSMIEYFLSRGTFLMNRLTVAEIIKLKNGAGDYIWKPGLKSDEDASLVGLPLRMSTTMPTVAAGALSIALADWAEAYMIVDRMGITVQRDPYTVKPFIEFYSRKRVGGDVTNFQAIKIQDISAT